MAASVSRYEPNQIATALAEDHWGQMQQATPAATEPVCVGDLIRQHPQLRQPVIEGLLRQGETMNLISAPKMGKSWLVTDLALAIATGRDWLGQFPCKQGDVLILDNELHGETSANRIPKVGNARSIALADYATHVWVQNLRGSLQDVFTLSEYFDRLEPGRFRAIILDAFYRFMPRGMDENDNGTMASLYNHIDRYADRLGCSFILIHHTTKGNQSGKSVTDVGAGAGSQSRAADTHLVLRPHEEQDAVVLDAAVRSWPPVCAQCLRWVFPIWMPADDLDPTQLRSERSTRKKDTDRQNDTAPWELDVFVARFVSDAPQDRVAILDHAVSEGLSERQATRLLRAAEQAGLAHRWTSGRNRPSRYARVAQSQEGDRA